MIIFLLILSWLSIGSEADNRGVSMGDVIVEVNGRDCRTKTGTEVADMMNVPRLGLSM